MIRNLRENEVNTLVRLYVTPEVLAPRGLAWSEGLLADIACFMLNRIGPRYVTSERGLNYFQAETRFVLPADLLALLFEALESLQRGSQAAATGEHTGGWYCFPIFFGRVLDGDGLIPLDGAKVECLVDGKHLSSTMRPFDNPYTTHHATQGVFSFWPDPVVAALGDGERAFHVKLHASHPARKTEWSHVHKLVLSPLEVDPWQGGSQERVILPDALL
ncbi:MAG: late competence development ComFB family protein [Spirochaetes bacterium]|nr:late competence development ComFB family protein [Spirochaetota bacterium]